MTLVRSALDYLSYLLCPPVTIVAIVVVTIGWATWMHVGPTKIGLIGEVDGCRVYEIRGSKTSHIATCGGQSVVAKTADRLQAGAATYDIHEVKE